MSKEEAKPEKRVELSVLHAFAITGIAVEVIPDGSSIAYQLRGSTLRNQLGEGEAVLLRRHGKGIDMLVVKDPVTGEWDPMSILSEWLKKPKEWMTAPPPEPKP